MLSQTPRLVLQWLMAALYRWCPILLQQPILEGLLSARGYRAGPGCLVLRFLPGKGRTPLL